MDEISFKPIGTVKCAGQYKFEAPRQGVFSSAEAVIELDNCFAGDALTDLAGFERIWVIFVFHRNIGQSWKAKTAPPCAPEKRKYSLFATRSPYRPNPVGMSCVILEKIEKNRLFIRAHDLLDGTPVLDIKPYIPQADAFPDAAAGWRDELEQGDFPEWQVEFTGLFFLQADFLSRIGAPDMRNFARVQLRCNPLDAERRRLFALGGNKFELGCRTWRLIFTAFPDEQRIVLEKIRSNYRDEELQPETDDRYGDKDMHRKFAEFCAES